MSWSFYLLLIPTIAYFLAAMVYIFQQNWPLTIVYGCYGGANIGLLWLDRLMQVR